MHSTTVMEMTHVLTMGTGRAQWWPYQLHDGRRSAVLRCPKCGLPAFVTEHKIDAEGNVDGPFSCRSAECGFETHLLLKGWTEEEIQPVAPSP